MRVDVVTLFPEWLAQLENYGVVGRALRAGIIALNAWNPRDQAASPSRRVDDRAYGGGPGMVMQAAPLARTLDAIEAAQQLPADRRAPVILLSPQGEPFTQAWAADLALRERLVLVCGRYEGVDQRFVDARVDVELSVGDFVVSGGELPAMMIIDAVARLIEGVLGDRQSAVADSFVAGRLDHPHYTRPETALGRGVPPVLLSGDHDRIRRWREKQALGMTWLKRPDVLAALDLSAAQRAALAEFVAELAAQPDAPDPEQQS